MSINRKASKKHSQIEEVQDVENLSYERYIENFGEKRLVNRLLKGRVVKPCGRECREYGLKIAETLNHTSFINFKELMNDKEFLIEAANITPKPTEIINYFWLYVNPYLKNDDKFKLEFLKSVYLNENVYELEVINIFVDFCGLKKENEILLQDKEVKMHFEKMLNQCSKGKRRNSIIEVLNTFNVKEEEIDLRDLIDIQFFDMDV